MAVKIHNLYGGTEEIRFDEGKHVYRHPVHGIVPNVTGVCKILPKPKLIPWSARKASEYWLEKVEPGELYDEVQLARFHKEAKEAYNTYSGERRDVGKLIHDWCEKMALHEMGQMKAPKMPVNVHVRNGVDAWKQWVSKYPRREWVFAERIMFHDEDIHVGTADGGLYLHGRNVEGEPPVVLDYKTGNGVWSEAGIQTAAYARSAFKEFGSPWERAERMVVHLQSTTGKMSEWNEERIRKRLTGGTVNEDYDCFVNLLGAYNWIINGPNKWSFLSG